MAAASGSFSLWPPAGFAITRARKLVVSTDRVRYIIVTMSAWRGFVTRELCHRGCSLSRYDYENGHSVRGRAAVVGDNTYEMVYTRNDAITHGRLLISVNANGGPVRLVVGGLSSSVGPERRVSLLPNAWTPRPPPPCRRRRKRYTLVTLRRRYPEARMPTTKNRARATTQHTMIGGRIIVARRQTQPKRFGPR